MKNNNFIGVIFIIAAAIWAVWSIVSGAAGLAKSGASPLSESSSKGSLCEFKAVYAKEIYNIDHKLMVILPLGTERFYFVIGENDDPVPVLVKASRAWFDSNFSENGIAKREVTIKGEIRHFDSSDGYKLKEVNAELGNIDKTISVSTVKYADTLYRTRYALKLAAGVLAVSVGAVLAVLLCSKKLAGAKMNVLLIYLIVAILALLAVALGSRVM